MMNARPVFVGEPLAPEDLERLDRIYSVARWATSRSRHDPASHRLAAMVIRFYQLGVRDEDVLLATVIGTHADLAEG